MNCRSMSSVSSVGSLPEADSPVASQSSDTPSKAAIFAAWSREGLPSPCFHWVTRGGATPAAFAMSSCVSPFRFATANARSIQLIAYYDVRVKRREQPLPCWNGHSDLKSSVLRLMKADKSAGSSEFTSRRSGAQALRCIDVVGPGWLDVRTPERRSIRVL